MPGKPNAAAEVLRAAVAQVEAKAEAARLKAEADAQIAKAEIAELEYEIMNESVQIPHFWS